MGLDRGSFTLQGSDGPGVERVFEVQHLIAPGREQGVNVGFRSLHGMAERGVTSACRMALPHAVALSRRVGVWREFCFPRLAQCL